MSEENIKFELALAATRPPGGSIKEPGEQAVLEQSPPPSHLKTWRPALTPSVANPIRTRSSSPKRAASSKTEPSECARRTLADSPKPGHSRGAQRGLADSQIAEYFFDSGSGSDVFSSSDDEEPTEDTLNMQHVARKLRELAVLEEERQTEALEDFLIDADIATEELAVDEPVDPPSIEDVRESASSSNLSEVAGPEYSWSDDFSLFSGQEEEYTRDLGPTTSCGPNPLDIFNLIWDPSILAQIVRRTNDYALQTKRGSLPKYLDNWVETTVDEIRRFFGMLILMTLDYRALLDEYWTTGTMGMPKFRALMTYNRFQLLLRFLHFADNSDITPAMSTYEKRIAKIAPVIDYLNNKFSSIYTPERELYLDETLLLWKGRLCWVQCCRTKAARFGIKAVELCEASTGYLLKSILYAGKNSSFVQGDIHGLDNKTAKVVLELMDSFMDVGHLVVMDNWYNQLSLARFLKSRGTDVVGTMNRNRASVPPEIKNADQTQMQCDEEISRHCGDIAITTWKDATFTYSDLDLVTVISTSHNNNQVQGRRGGKGLMKPVAAEAYNKSMRRVGLKERRLSPFKMQRKRGLEWYKKVFFRLLNTSVLNAYVIYCKRPVAAVLSHVEFRYSLGAALVKTSAPIRPNVSLVERLDGKENFPVFSRVARGAAVEGKKTKREKPHCYRRCKCRED